MEKRNKNAEAKGYLNEYIHFFDINDSANLEVSYHYHTFHKCIIVIEGELDYTVEGREYKLNSGDIIIVPKGEAHKLKVESESYHRAIVYFSEEIIDMLTTKSLDLRGQIKLIGSKFPNTLKIKESQRQKLQLIEGEFIQANNTCGHESIRLLRFMEWLIMYFRLILYSEPKKTLNPMSKRLNLVIKYIETNIGNEITIDMIAKQVYISKFYLMKQFKETMGISIHQYIIQERIAKARELMKKERALTEIAFEVGFKDYSTFLRAFKRQYGHSPREFMKILPTKP